MAMALTCGVMAGCTTTPDPQPEKPEEEKFRITTADVRCEDEYQERWMSVPDSRLVVNPFSFHATADTTQSEYCNRPMMPLNIGFLDPYSNHLICGNSILNNMVLLYDEQEDGTLATAETYTTAWQPDRLDAEAEYASGMKLGMVDFFGDAKTVVRRITAENGTPVYAGRYEGKLSETVDAIGIENEHYRAAVAFGGEMEIKVYVNEEDLLAGKNAMEVTAAPETGYWQAKGAATDLACAIDTKDVSVSAVVETARKMFAEGTELGSLLETRTVEWNRVLNKIPYAQFLDMPHLEELDQVKGVTSEEVLQDFYESWALIYSSIMPENPEHNYPYKQVACGKASMWDEGHAHSSQSASWESFFGMQFLSYIDPDSAWSAYRGMMSLVDEDGVLGGESLPSEKAHTAWILYQNKPDKEALQEIYPSLKRYLCWRRENPRWIHGDHDNPLEKDYDFAASLLLDLQFAEKIAEELAMAEDVKFWQDMRQSLYKDIQTWFYLPGDEDPYQYNLGNGSMQRGAIAWVVKSLWADELEGETLDRTINYLKKNFNPAGSFCGLTAMKYDGYAYTSLGLVAHGELEMAAQMLEAGMRDVVSARFLGEVYDNATTGIDPDTGVSCTGVRPSLFGASIMIDSVYMTNGFVRYWGGIAAMNLYDRVSTITGITVNGKEYTLTVNGLNGTATISCDGENTVKQVARGEFVQFDI